MGVNWNKLTCPDDYMAVAYIEDTEGLYRCQIKKINSEVYEEGQYVYLSNQYHKVGTYDSQDIYIVPVSAIKGYEST